MHEVNKFIIKLKQNPIKDESVDDKEELVNIEKNKQLALVIFSYLIFFVPWAASPRIMFLYHYLPSVPFLCLLLAFTLAQIKKIGDWGNYAVTGYLVLVALVFIYFYPHWSAFLVPQTWANHYYWLPSWK